jgi:hypothetical protein
LSFSIKSFSTSEDLTPQPVSNRFLFHVLSLFLEARNKGSLSRIPHYQFSSNLSIKRATLTFLTTLNHLRCYLGEIQGGNERNATNDVADKRGQHEADEVGAP